MIWSYLALLCGEYFECMERDSQFFLKVAVKVVFAGVVVRLGSLISAAF